MLRKTITLVLTLAMAAAAAYADDSLAIYLIQPSSSQSAAEAWAMGMTLPTDVARMLTPSRFSKRLFSSVVTIETEGSVPFLTLGRTELERSSARVLYEILVRPAAPTALPKPSKRVTISFSLSELVVKGGDAADSPVTYALRRGIAKSAWLKGTAWVESLSYDGAGMFTAVVALGKY